LVVSQFIWKDNKLNFLFVVHDLHEDVNALPLGPAYVAQALRHKDVDVSFFCQDVYHQSDEELEAFIKDKHFDFVGIGFLAARFNRIRGTLAAIRRACTHAGSMMILGGHGPSPIPEFILDATGADAAVIGEGDVTTVELVEAVRDGKSLASVAGIVWRNDAGRLIVNEPRKLIPKLDSIPFPAYDLLPMEMYTRAVVRHNPQLNEDRTVGYMISSRGCVGRCSFCYRMDKGLRVRSLDNIVDEIRLLHDTYGVNYLCIQDETIGAANRRLMQFCRAIRALPFKLQWVSSLRSDALQDEDTAKILKESGCVYLSLGLESLNQHVLDLMRKRTTVEQNLRAIRNCRAAALNVGLNLIWGCPGDTVETLWQQVHFINEMSAGIECRTIRPVTPYPGSPLYSQAIAEGKLKGPADFFEKFKNSDYITVNFTAIPTEMMIEELYKANCAIIDAFCDHPNVKKGGNYYLVDRGRMKQLFYDLYFNQYYEFRGIR
jgi:anaerobic magnesium-protoporphyrin IX monomethyl ester cyclase